MPVFGSRHPAGEIFFSSSHSAQDSASLSSSLLLFAMPPVLSLPVPDQSGGASTSPVAGSSFHILEEEFEDICAKRRKLLHPPTEYPISSCLALEPNRPMLETTDDFSPAENEDPEFQFVGFKKGKRIYRRVRPAPSVSETSVIRQPLVSAAGEEVPRGDYWRTLEYSGFITLHPAVGLHKRRQGRSEAHCYRGDV